MAQWQEKRHKPVLPLYMAALIWPVGALVLPPYTLSNLLILAGLSLMVYAVGSVFCPTRVERVPVRYATGSEDVDTLLAGIEENLQKLQTLNDQIPDTVLSRQMDRMAAATHSMLSVVAENPDKARQIDRFARYYLPESLKILGTWASLEKNGVKGQNADQLLQEIRQSAQTMATAFENQLDALYSAEVLDIAADIAVLDGIFKSQNLTQ